MRFTAPCSILYQWPSRKRDTKQLQVCVCVCVCVCEREREREREREEEEEEEEEERKKVIKKEKEKTNKQTKNTSLDYYDSLIPVSEKCYTIYVLRSLAFEMYFAVKLGKNSQCNLSQQYDMTYCQLSSRHMVHSRSQLSSNNHGIHTQ